MGRHLVVAVFLVGCNGPKLEPPSVKGGFVVRCVGITDLAPVNLRPNPTPACFAVESDDGIDKARDGACNCAGTDYPAPALTKDFPPLGSPNYSNEIRDIELGGAQLFGDSLCATIVADTCVPFRVQTTSKYHDPAGGPAGYIAMDKVIEKNINDFFRLKPSFFYAPFMDPDEIEIKEQAAKDANDTFNGACIVAQMNVLTQELYHVPAYAPATMTSRSWAELMLIVGGYYNPRTSHLSGLNLHSEHWGTYAGLNLDSRVGLSVYASHVYRPFDYYPGDVQSFTACNVGQDAPYGLGAVRDFPVAAYTARPPGSTPNPSPRQSTLLASGSAGTLTINNSSVALNLSGTIELAVHHCTNDGCTATLRSMRISAAPFTVHGREVTSLEILGLENDGVLKGNSLLFPAFQGTAYLQLKDGSHARLPVEDSAILAKWDVQNDRFVMAFSFTGKLSDNETATVNGTAFSNHIETSPIARASVAAPASVSIANGVATVECAGVQGTDVTLSSALSSDREDLDVQTAWYVDGEPKATSADFTFNALPLGSKKVSLMAYDTHGFGGQDDVELDIVDTSPPELVTQDMCVFPPNHQHVCLRLFAELAVSAVDVCTGDANQSITIADATSDTDGLLSSWNDGEICIDATREGQNGGSHVTAIIRAVDANGNVIEKPLVITVPHDLRGKTKCFGHSIASHGGAL